MAATDSGEFATKVSDLISDFNRAIKDIRCDDSIHVQDQIHQNIFQDSLDRFKLWAGSLGAFHSPSDPRSLEHRLRKAPQVKSRINELLAALSGDLRETFDEFNENTNAVIGDRQIVTTTQDEADLLDMLGLAEDDSTDLCSRISHTCDKIAEDIGHLFKVAALIGKSIARDRYARAETASKEKFDDQYDIAHVKAKFQQGEAPDWLLLRLGQAITKRRQYIKYVREHRSRIDNDSQQPRDPEVPVVKSLGHRSQVTSSPKAVTLTSRPSQMPTLATTVVSNVLLNVEQTFEDDRSVTTVNTTRFDEDLDRMLSVPPLTDYATLGREFACPFCPTTIKFNSQGSWKRHVYADLRAYLCTNEECGMTMFEQKRSWIDHEMEKHWRSWSCYLCNFTSNRQPEAESHLEKCHPGTLSEEDGHAMTYMTSRPMDYVDASRCQLCGWGKVLLSKGSVTTVSRQSFMGHLAQHLEQLALFAIPRVESGENSGSVESDLAANRGSQASRSTENSSNVGDKPLTGVETTTRVGPTEVASSPMQQTLDSQAASFSEIGLAFPSQSQGHDSTFAWMTSTEPHDPGAVTSQDEQWQFSTALETVEAAQQEQINDSRDSEIQAHESDEGSSGDEATEARKELMAELQYPGMFDRQNTIRQPLTNTFDWVYDKPSPFENWLSSQNSLFWITGKPGSGKSVMMRMLASDKRTQAHLLRGWADVRAPKILSFYFGSVKGSTLQKIIKELVRSLLYQLMQDGPIWVYSKGDPRFALRETLRALPPRSVLLFVDCSEGCEEDLDDLLPSILEVSDMPCAKVCIASRPDMDFLNRIGFSPDLRLDDANMEDIKLFVYIKLAALETGISLTGHLARTLIKRCQGSFAQAELLVEMVQSMSAQGVGEKTMEHRINEMPYSDRKTLQ